MTKKSIVFYTTTDGSCTPCDEVTKLVEAGKFESPDTDEVDLVDISTDEGFERFQRDILSKGDGGVPSAYFNGKKCRVEVLGDDTVRFDCSKDAPGEGPGEKSSPPEGGEEPPSAQPETPDGLPVLPQ